MEIVKDNKKLVDLNMEKMVFAPVIIPTLNRIEHFKQCIESLADCKYAEETELFISVDYPPSEKYMEGYHKVCAYLQKGINGFKETHIYYQRENLGPNKNFRYLKELVSGKFDRWISTEDDNEFSYNFLEYMNKGLMLFEKDDKVLNICALQDKGPWDLDEDTAFFQQNCPAYGLGCWKNKEVELDKILTDYFLIDIGKSTDKVNMLFRKSKLFYQQYIEGILCGKNPIFWDDFGKICLCDTVRTVYALCADKYFIAPKVSKVRNWGNDGSGVNMKKQSFDAQEMWKLDDDSYFEYRISFDEEKMTKYGEYIHGKMYALSWIYIVKAKMKYMLYRVKVGI